MSGFFVIQIGPISSVITSLDLLTGVVVSNCRLLGIQSLESRRRSSQAIFVAKVLTGRTDAPNILSQLNVYAPERRIRQRELNLETRNTDYGYREPIRFMSSVLNECFYLFDFNVSIETFRVRLRTS